MNIYTLLHGLTKDENPPATKQYFMFIDLIYKHMQNLRYRCRRNIDDVIVTSLIEL